MADVAINTAVAAGSETSIGDGRWLVATNKDTLYAFFNAGDDDLDYHKSTDGGATWGAAVGIKTGSISNFSVWYDKWTPSDTGTKIHIFYTNADAGAGADIFYRSLDTSSDTLGTEESIEAVTNDVSGGSQITASITKAIGGNLYACFRGLNQIGGAVERFYRSVDAGDNWTTRTSVFETAADLCTLFPGNETDTNDIWAIFWDVSADELSLKVYDDSGNSWAETAIGAAVDTGHASANSQFFGSIRHSDKHLILVFWNAFDAAGADLKCYDINGAASITAKTNVLTDLDDIACCSLFIDQNTGHLYCGYLGDDDSGDAYLATVQVFYKKSTDGGATWGAEVPYSEDAADDFRCLTCDLGGTTSLFALAWYDDDDDDLFCGVTNSIEITPPAAGAGSTWWRGRGGWTN